MVCLQKVTVSGVLVFFQRNPTQQHSLGVVVACVWSHIYFAQAPFRNHHDNVIARASSASLALLLLGALVLPHGTPPTGWRRTWGAPLLIAFTAFPIVTIVWGIGQEVLERFRDTMTEHEDEDERGNANEEEKQLDEMEVREENHLDETDVIKVTADTAVVIEQAENDDGTLELTTVPPAPEVQTRLGVPWASPLCCQDW